MVAGTHPEDVDLFDYVEGDLPADRRAELEVHLASCAPCAEQVARVQAGRDALREGQFLQLPPRRREGILLNLPAQQPARRRTPGLSPKQLLAILTPIAAVAAVAVALVTTGGGTDKGVGGGGEAAATAGGAGETFREEDAQKALAPVSLPGPAAAVADELRRKGFDARVVGQHVEVRNATRAEVKRALEGRRTLSAKSVKIVIVP